LFGDSVGQRLHGKDDCARTRGGVPRDCCVPVIVGVARRIKRRFVMTRHISHARLKLLLGVPCLCTPALASYDSFLECRAGPEVEPSPPPPGTPQDCLEAYDLDQDGDVDLSDFAALVVAFASNYPDVTVALTPYNPPIVIPASGGTFDYAFELTNHEATLLTIGAWTAYTYPDGSASPPVFGPVELTLPAGWTAQQDLSEYVPGDMPSVTYTYTAHVGRCPRPICSSDAFAVEKLPEATGW
jgi:hypothetical protein